jgi:hypothetical protein
MTLCDINLTLETFCGQCYQLSSSRKRGPSVFIAATHTETPVILNLLTCWRCHLWCRHLCLHLSFWPLKLQAGSLHHNFMWRRPPSGDASSQKKAVTRGRMTARTTDIV